MKKYRIHASYTVYCSMEVEAESIEDAKDIAYEADGGDFDSDEHGDWDIDNVIELEEV